MWLIIELSSLWYGKLKINVTSSEARKNIKSAVTLE